MLGYFGVTSAYVRVCRRMNGVSGGRGTTLCQGEQAHVDVRRATSGPVMHAGACKHMPEYTLGRMWADAGGRYQLVGVDRAHVGASRSPLGHGDPRSHSEESVKWGTRSQDQWGPRLASPLPSEGGSAAPSSSPCCALVCLGQWLCAALATQSSPALRCPFCCPLAWLDFSPGVLPKVHESRRTCWKS